MPYRIRKKELTGEAVRRIAQEQADAAIADAADADVENAVHAVRMRCKKLRALVKLVHSSFDGYEVENADYRETARLLSGSRDAAVRLAALEKVIGDASLDPRALRPIRERLEQERDDAVKRGGNAPQKLDQVKRRLLGARGRIACWRLNGEEFDALRGGLERTYRRCREQMAECSDPTPERLHGWRKRVKYHWYHCRLLRNVWRRPMTARCAEGRTLGELLGEGHDLVLMRGHLQPAQAPGTRDLIDALTRRHAAPNRQAFALGRRLFSEDPEAFMARMESYWEGWRTG
ncbi:MAG TPA: CHAD domain-containing protein [Woeseiaceae bacterium]|nr:CHAD domain-containing protein [Woeseiaceae bacterium]